MKAWKILVLMLLLAPLTIGAETITWVLPTTHVDNTPIDAATRATLGVYLRGWKDGNPGAKIYFGETRNGATSWTDNILVRMNQWGATNNPAAWVPVKSGDKVFITASTSLKYLDNGVTRELDGPEGPAYAWVLPGAAVPPPVKPPSCNAPSGLTITQ